MTLAGSAPSPVKDASAPGAEAGDMPLLDSTQMALFAAKGFLRFDAVVPEEVNALCIEEMVAEVAARQDRGTFCARGGQRRRGPAGTMLPGGGRDPVDVGASFSPWRYQEPRWS